MRWDRGIRNSLSLDEALSKIEPADRLGPRSDYLNRLTSKAVAGDDTARESVEKINVARALRKRKN